MLLNKLLFTYIEGVSHFQVLYNVPKVLAVGGDLIGEEDVFRVHVVKGLECELEIADQGIAAGFGEVLADDNTHQLHLFGMWCHGVCRHYPAAFAELMRTIADLV